MDRVTKEAQVSELKDKLGRDSRKPETE